MSFIEPDTGLEAEARNTRSITQFLFDLAGRRTHLIEGSQYAGISGFGVSADQLTSPLSMI